MHVQSERAFNIFYKKQTLSGCFHLCNVVYSIMYVYLNQSLWTPLFHSQPRSLTPFDQGEFLFSFLLFYFSTYSHFGIGIYRYWILDIHVYFKQNSRLLRISCLYNHIYKTRYTELIRSKNKRCIYSLYDRAIQRYIFFIH
jgi:hypothetical protein